MHDYVLRIVLVGEAMVGKTSLCETLSIGKNSSSYQATIGVDFSISDINTLDGKKVKCQLWDTAGCERFRSITKSYYQNAGVILLMFDLSNKQSFADVYYWIQEIKKFGDDGTKILLVGNKSDLTHAVDSDEINEFVKMYNGITYVEASVKTDYNEFHYHLREYITDLLTDNDYISQTKGISPAIKIKVSREEKDEYCCCGVM